MRAKINSVLSDLAQSAQAEHLKAAGISQDRPFPAHKVVQPAEIANQLMPGPQIKMISITKNDMCAQLFDRILGHALDRSRRGQRHEDWCFHRAMRRSDAPSARRRRLRFDCEKRSHQFCLLVNCGLFVSY